MKTILLATAAVTLAFGGAASAACVVPQGQGPGGQPSKCAVGPMDYPDAQAQWARLRDTLDAQLSGAVLHRPSVPVRPAGMPQPGASQPSG